MRKKEFNRKNTEMAMMLELSDKNFKAAIIKMIQQTFMNIFEMNDETENLSKEV